MSLRVAVAGPQFVSDMIKGLFPHLQCRLGRPHGFEGKKSQQHDDPVEARSCIRFKEPQRGTSQVCHVHVQNFGEGDVEAFASNTPPLARVEQVPVGRVVHGAASEEDADHQVEISFKKMDDSKFLQMEIPRFFVNHNIDHTAPSVKIEALAGGGGGKSVDHAKNALGLVLAAEMGGCWLLAEL